MARYFLDGAPKRIELWLPHDLMVELGRDSDGTLRLSFGHERANGKPDRWGSRIRERRLRPIHIVDSSDPSILTDAERADLAVATGKGRQ